MSSPSLTMAQRHHGVCQGPLYRTVETPRRRSSTSSKVSEFCRLVGVRLVCYESCWSWTSGNPPSAIFSIVGASAIGGASDFRVVTNQGTHLLCTAPTNSCREVWLAALTSGLERHLGQPEPKQFKKVKPRLQPTTSKKYNPKFCSSCGKLERLEFPLSTRRVPLSQYGLEQPCDVCPRCDASQGVVDHCIWVSELYASAHQEQVAILNCRRIVLSKVQPTLDVSDSEPATNLELNPLSHDLASRALRSPECLGCIRVSPTLQRLVLQFQQELVGVLEFVELMEHATGMKDAHLAQLKTQAFRVAGDMGTALKLLHEHALPTEEVDDTTGVNHDSLDLLKCILEFFLDLLEEGELTTLGFFWPQLCNIHLQMLPPMNAASLQRIELMEDFLLTVATKYSIHLAVDLIWSHTADLEDSRGLGRCLKRKSAVLRFLCELESLLFDFEAGWGGGSVTVGNFLSPSNHQIQILKSQIGDIQNFRMQQTDLWLSRSQRMDKLSSQKQSSPPEILAQEALRIAKNADYLSSHLAFTKRLCDIAEKLRFLDVEQRPQTLETELAKLNASGTMGGDPLNRAKEHHSRVIRIPTTEGHVFRSKERTPVLLLAEIMEEGSEEIMRGEEREEEEKKEQPSSPLHNVSTEEYSGDDAGNATKSAQSPESSKRDEEVNEPGSDEMDIAAEQAAKDDDANEVEEEEVEVEVEADIESKIKDSSVAKEDPVARIDEGEQEQTKINDEAKPQNEMEEDDGENSLQTVSDLDDSGLEMEQKVEVQTPRTPKKTTTRIRTLSKDSRDYHALRRFDGSTGEPMVITPTASKSTVEALVTNVVAKQLHLPNLMDIPTEEATATTEVKEKESDELTEEEPTVDTTPNEGVEQNVSRVKHFSTPRISTLGGEPRNVRFSKTGDTRREVLNTIMEKGMSKSHSIAADAMPAMQRHLQDLERRRAVELLLTGEDPKNEQKTTDRHELLSLGIRSVSNEDLEKELSAEISEENEAMESIRLLLIQYQVAQGSLSLNDAAAVLAPRDSLKQMNKRKSKEGTIIMHNGREFPEIDAGDIDPRLVGCGVLPPAVFQALTLFKASMISSGELLDLVTKDLEFVKKSVEMEESRSKLNEDSAFWGRFAFGERWAEKRSRIASSSAEAVQPGWDLIGVIVKSNDDLRQEAFVMQLIELCREAFEEAGLELWLFPYRILSTGRTTGIIEMVRNAMSFDSLKKRPGYGKGGLREHLIRMTQFAADPGEAFKSAQRNFVRSLAAYSLLSFLFLFKDRHNGNLLLDTAGHVIHIDFGFVFGVAPGGSFSLEMSTPFKLTEEMIEVMDGLRSSLFSEFVTLFCCGFLALQAHCDTFLTLVEITCKGSSFKCFEGRDSEEVVEKLRERLNPDLDKEESIAFCLDIIKASTQSYGTAQYDYFQYLSQGIAA